MAREGSRYAELGGGGGLNRGAFDCSRLGESVTDAFIFLDVGPDYRQEKSAIVQIGKLNLSSSQIGLA